ncbi:Uncharacterised protein [Mycobacterium tuberculosis]|nr:Uncharacterised protein [Mycobacterium tuberculosis]
MEAPKAPEAGLAEGPAEGRKAGLGAPEARMDPDPVALAGHSDQAGGQVAPADRTGRRGRS